MRSVLKKYPGRQSRDGAGVNLTRVFSHRDVKELDPFLLLDYFDSKDPSDYLNGFPWHPHRGIETITYLIDGKIDHKDSLGNKGTIESYGCQWMTAGSGILHQEMPKRSEYMLGAQLWLNLPKANKFAEPTYRDITAKDLEIYEDDHIINRIICGHYKGLKGPVSGTYVDPIYFDITIKSNGTFKHQIDEEEKVFLLMISGQIKFPDQSVVDEVETRGVLLNQGREIEITSNHGARFILMAGKPLHEEIAWGGPIVMNTKEELDQAFKDLNQGTFIKK